MILTGTCSVFADVRLFFKYGTFGRQSARPTLIIVILFSLSGVGFNLHHATLSNKPIVVACGRNVKVLIQRVNRNTNRHMQLKLKRAAKRGIWRSHFNNTHVGWGGGGGAGTSSMEEGDAA